MGDDLASEARGYPPGESDKAKEDMAERHALTAMAQSSPDDPESGLKNPASRGVPELDPNKDSGSEEQAKGKESKNE